MICVRYTKLRDIESHVLETIRSTHRGKGISPLAKGGQETGLLSQKSSYSRILTLIHLKCDYCDKKIKRECT